MALGAFPLSRAYNGPHDAEPTTDERLARLKADPGDKAKERSRSVALQHGGTGEHRAHGEISRPSDDSTGDQLRSGAGQSDPWRRSERLGDALDSKPSLTMTELLARLKAYPQFREAKLPSWNGEIPHSPETASH